ncbi:MAG: glycosyltransferase [Verrucomicrobiales bacterium]|jgi:heptose III glucuronosyltransferase|nr:glycosyltransferase [Verrucomicrobiales bacterium]
MPTLSVIVPLYNAGKFFAPFMESLLAQNIAGWEIIIVNDGSTDGSGLAARTYAERHPFIRVIDQPNQGVSVARNTGLSAAVGRYVAFPDADDVLRPGMYRTLLLAAEERGLDLAQANGEYEWEERGNARTPIFPPRLKTTGVIDGAAWLKAGLESRKFLHVVWLAVYRLDFLRRHHLDRFAPGLHHQDIPWTTEVLYNARRVMYCARPFYWYRIHGQSVSHVRAGDPKLFRDARHYMKIAGMLDELNLRYQETITIHPVFRWQITKEALGVYHSARQAGAPAVRAQICRELLDRKLDQLMWRNAVGLRQKWRLWRYLRDIRRWARECLTVSGS